ncbi:hypothetical protein MKX01_009373 [Papaver californicum]|nr:hypothetical protein MKX01_009373 [Papaver californicum]
MKVVYQIAWVLEFIRKLEDGFISIWCNKDIASTSSLALSTRISSASSVTKAIRLWWKITELVQSIDGAQRSLVYCSDMSS